MQSIISDSKETLQKLLPSKSDVQVAPGVTEPPKKGSTDESKEIGEAAPIKENPEGSDPTKPDVTKLDTSSKGLPGATDSIEGGSSKQSDFITLNEGRHHASDPSDPTAGIASQPDSAATPEQTSNDIEDDGKQDGAQASPHESVKAFFAANHTVEFIRLQWLDYSASVRCRLITPRQALRLASESKSVSTAAPLTSAFLVDGSFHEVSTGQKDQLVPDWSTLQTLHYEPTHASVLCFIKDAAHGFATDPRHLLKQAEAEIQEKHGMAFLIGLEIEFYLLRSPEAILPVDDDVHPYCSTASLRPPYQAILTAATSAIEAAGIPVWASHTETVAGQFEISTDPLSPLKAADSLIYIYEAIKTIAWKHGYHATMHPKPFDKLHGVGAHMHLSLQHQTEKDDSFLQGVLTSVPAISAISMPNYDSWLRRDFAGGDYIGWDIENRMSSIRKIERAYWEMRFIDCMANPYLTLALILGTGMKAWEKATPLSVKATSEKGDEEGEKVRAPRDLKDAIGALKKDDEVKNVLGEALWDRYVRYKQHEEQVLGEMTLQERRQLAIRLF